MKQQGLDTQQTIWTRSYYSTEPVFEKSIWQNKWTGSEMEISILELDFNWCAIQKKKARKVLITFIVTFRLPNTCYLKSYFSDQSCHLFFSSTIHQNPSVGITYEERKHWRCPEETGVSRLHLHWSWLYCSSFPAWTAVCKGWAGGPTFGPSIKQSCKIPECHET